MLCRIVCAVRSASAAARADLHASSLFPKRSTIHTTPNTPAISQGLLLHSVDLKRFARNQCHSKAQNAEKTVEALNEFDGCIETDETKAAGNIPARQASKPHKNAQTFNHLVQTLGQKPPESRLFTVRCSFSTKSEA